jgi:hypothetical protein
MTTITKNDPQAIEKYTRKLEALTKLQNDMKAINKICSTVKLTNEQKSDKLKELYKLSDNTIQELLNPKYSFEKQGFQTWRLTNNNAEISRINKRIKEIQSYQSEEDVIADKADCSFEICHNENRIRIYYPAKPSSEVIQDLKAHGFKWAPTLGAWSGYINPITENFVSKLN